ncbi:uncharacterized protein LOC135974969 isoform X2 [Chrysemys picta bellii]|uniref:uncharacterized protein LOC135974969 isoform X2 n=1 Tax=Chrysemys picta bellii TaxID=8478 RepID=UPI0032B19337
MICLREMDPELVRRMLTYLISTLRLAVELFLKIQSDSESEESDDAIEPRNAYDTKLLVSSTNMLSTVERRFWARETSTEWWDHIVMDVWDDEQWLQNFRMRKATFMGLCEELAPTLRRKDTRLRAALPVEKRVAIAIRKLATPDCYRSVANQFGVGKSTVGIVLMQVCKAINRILLRRTVTLGNVQEIVDGFAQMGFFPRAEDHGGEVEMPIVILGDPAYLLMPWLMKPYTGSLDSSKERFNYRLSRCRMTVECAFGRLKAR